ncbi:MAG: endonuclease Q family protein [Xylanivirga thermophila]|jgi:uncharacterized protein (TIGR00375 family)|uniref:endonuclease Q family protein n=1 Tax=Xylanivirga thermophila TaxID=2496273 RepID=UPI0039F4CA5B
MEQYFVDIHVHVGRSSNGRMIKYGTSRDLTLKNIAYESRYRKGINVIGVVDCISPWIIDDMEDMLERGELEEIPDGGMIYKDDLVILAGAEIETREPSYGCNVHSLVFMPDFKGIKELSNIMKMHMTNMENNAIISRLSGRELLDIVDDLGGIYIPAHIFTPYKGFYGACTDRFINVFGDALDKIFAIELGLSADTYMACQVSELDKMAFTSNSDAHSLPKMGREYNILEMDHLSYTEVIKALKGEDGRRIVSNYGLNPVLGKYHRTFCLECGHIIDAHPPVTKCPNDPKHKVVMGVKDRLTVIRDREDCPIELNRSPYHYQVPLEFLPGVGPKTIGKLLDKFGTEMNILHRATTDQIASVVGEKVADMVIKGREGKLNIAHGGGGVYGKVIS